MVEINEVIQEVIKEAQIEVYNPEEINLVKNQEVNTWSKIKRYTSAICKNKGELFFLIHNQDRLTGKPQIVFETMQKFPMVSLRGKVGDESGTKHYYYFGDKIDSKKTYEIDNLSFYFWIYRIIEDGKEYLVLSEKKLTTNFTILTGTKIEISYYNEIIKALKFKSFSNIFIVQSSESAFKLLTKEELVDLTKTIKMDFNMFTNLLYTKQGDNRIYNHPYEFNVLLSSILLSSKYEGYPLHLLVLGSAGTGKTTFLECLHEKFDEPQEIHEAGSSTHKSLIPSFKENPINLGYILKSVRVSFIDELLKMLERELRHNPVVNSFGDLNMLLEHKKRNIGSGNSNSLEVQSTSKLIITTNPMFGYYTLGSHIGLVDETTFSRLILWVQNKEEQEMIYNKDLPKLNQLYNINEIITNITNRVYTFPPNQNHNKLIIINNNNNNSSSKKNTCVVWGRKKELQGLYLSIYDTTNTFLSDYDFERVESIFNQSKKLVRLDMERVWKSRGLHHMILVMDGIVKIRCLFQDYDPSFTAKEEDYLLLEKVITKMIKTWETIL